MNLKPLCLLLSLCHAGSAAALGLGEISVRSHLGQPLHATVALLDATADITTDCLRIETGTSGLTPPLRAQLSIERSGGQDLLHIRTPQSVHDPVAQFVLVSDCEVRLQREYVVLLDPPALTAPVIAQEAPTLAPANTTAVAAPVAQPPRASVPGARRSSKRASAAASRLPIALTQPVVPRTQRAPASSAPRLVLSGKRSAPRAADVSFALRLDTRLPDPVSPPQENLTVAELSDDNTALTRKLAHLEAQLVALQQRNARLDAARRTAAPTATTPLPSGRPAQWPLYLLAMGLLTAGIALVAWLLRRHRRPPQTLILDDSPWTQSDTSETLSEMTSLPKAERMPEIAPPPTRTDGTVVKEDILDQAEVFMAHGHSNLAIHLLQEHLRDAPTESPVPWLLLLDLLHREGDTAGYAAASAECRRYYNVNLSEHPVSQDNENSQGLDSYPHLLEQLVQVWNSAERDTFLKDLIYDHRGGTRMGFKPAAYRDILLLRAIAQENPLAAAA